MTGDGFTYQDKLSFKETLMFHVRAMSKELSAEGLRGEYEDMVDTLVYMVWTYMDEDERARFDDYDTHQVDVQPGDKVKYGRARRYRVRQKMTLAFQVLRRMRVLIDEVPDFGFEGEYLDLPVRGAGNE